MFPSVEFAGLDISTWKIAVLAGIILSWVLFLKRASRLGYNLPAIYGWLLLSVPVGTLGAHLFRWFILVLTGVGTPASIAVGGRTALGSLVFCLVFSVIYIKYVIKSSPAVLLDAVAFTLVLTSMTGRFGCLLAGCCYGTPLPGSMKDSVFTVFALHADSYSYLSHAWEAYQNLPAGTLVWNLPLFFILSDFVNLLLTEYTYRNSAKWGLRPGTVFALSCTLYCMARVPIEYLRYENAVAGFMMNPWQLFTLIFFVCSFTSLIVLLMRRSPINYIPATGKVIL